MFCCPTKRNGSILSGLTTRIRLRHLPLVRRIQRLTPDKKEMKNMIANVYLIDRKNFSVSVSKKKKGEDKQGAVNKNYTFQNNSEAKKILSNINKEGANSLAGSKIRASVGADVINQSDPTKNFKQGVGIAQKSKSKDRLTRRFPP